MTDIEAISRLRTHNDAPVWREAPLSFVPGATVKFKEDHPDAVRLAQSLTEQDLIQSGQEFVIAGTTHYMDLVTGTGDATTGFRERLQLEFEGLPNSYQDYFFELVRPAPSPDSANIS